MAVTQSPTPRTRSPQTALRMISRPAFVPLIKSRVHSGASNWTSPDTAGRAWFPDPIV
ncbi:hypothetical protein TRIATDRAFT_301406 [Trichoderma atroviride IMI 206040]|uniref:Uncharacterized protein n=1 Tax=Hypocrea atroviridis (strain ATCC 20476 / IMI 206040) TaxID=452589 RepID=G9P618_HYPAI|nr:uncharacterized protein TRIATDRAFT_301406 [Trichoderma atroviride IMI 206040]EHK40572.1 hypothetical protein TRIATDRAFT_301406 [Trichoderma atroviride IMI 206040]